jgi:hypothetical protein
MKHRLEYGPALICDTGPRAGMWRVDVTGALYLTYEELLAWEAPGCELVISTVPREAPHPQGQRISATVRILPEEHTPCADTTP